jgi:hypothetical protein
MRFENPYGIALPEMRSEWLEYSAVLMSHKELSEGKAEVLTCGKES